MGFQTDMDKTRDAVAQLTAWCVLVALHQDLGEGASKLNRVAAEMDVLQKTNCSTMVLRGIKAAEEQRVEWLQGKASAEFPVPLLSTAPVWQRADQLPRLEERREVDPDEGDYIFSTSAPLLLWCPDKDPHQVVGRYLQEESWVGFAERDGTPVHPTHWMELPEGPGR